MFLNINFDSSLFFFIGYYCYAKFFLNGDFPTGFSFISSSECWLSIVMVCKKKNSQNIFSSEVFFRSIIDDFKAKNVVEISFSVTCCLYEFTISLNLDF